MRYNNPSFSDFIPEYKDLKVAVIMGKDTWEAGVRVFENGSIKGLPAYTRGTPIVLRRQRAKTFRKLSK